MNWAGIAGKWLRLKHDARTRWSVLVGSDCEDESEADRIDLSAEMWRVDAANDTDAVTNDAVARPGLGGQPTTFSLLDEPRSLEQDSPTTQVKKYPLL